ncbi:hypothetical protein K1719_030112 [Acacia pycnantha]|nr:hypothetical protein K1719_030112 [Acacia pycnantha]
MILTNVISDIKLSKLEQGGATRWLLREDGHSLAFGWNKHGQVVGYATCGGDFFVWLSSVEGSSILSAGLPQYGQLGHGADNEYNSKDSSVRLVYEAQPCPRAIAKLYSETIVKVACGTNHTGCYFVLFLLHLIVACGMGHSMVIVDGTNVGERLCQLDIYDGKAYGEDMEQVTTRSKKMAWPGGKGNARSNSSRAKGKAKVENRRGFIRYAPDNQEILRVDTMLCSTCTPSFKADILQILTRFWVLRMPTRRKKSIWFETCWLDIFFTT